MFYKSSSGFLVDSRSPFLRNGLYSFELLEVLLNSGQFFKHWVFFRIYALEAQIS